MKDPNCTVTNPSTAPQTAPVSTPENIRKFLENAVVWPGPNETGSINMYVKTVRAEAPSGSIGWPFKDLDAFISWARWVDRTEGLSDARICMSQQSECTTTKRGKPKAVTQMRNATWLRSIWIDCDIELKNKKKYYRTLHEAWAAIGAFRREVGLPFPSAVVQSEESLQIYWISETPLARDEWRPYAHGLMSLLRREGIKCDSSHTWNSIRLLPVPSTMVRSFASSEPVKLLHLGQRYDFSSALSLLPIASAETIKRAREGKYFIA